MLSGIERGEREREEGYVYAPLLHARVGKKDCQVERERGGMKRAAQASTRCRLVWHTPIYAYVCMCARFLEVVVDADAESVYGEDPVNLYTFGPIG